MNSRDLKVLKASLEMPEGFDGYYDDLVLEDISPDFLLEENPESRYISGFDLLEGGEDPTEIADGVAHLVECYTEAIERADGEAKTYLVEEANRVVKSFMSRGLHATIRARHNPNDPAGHGFHLHVPYSEDRLVSDGERIKTASRWDNEKYVPIGSERIVEIVSDGGNVLFVEDAQLRVIADIASSVIRRERR